VLKSDLMLLWTVLLAGPMLAADLLELEGLDIVSFRRMSKQEQDATIEELKKKKKKKHHRSTAPAKHSHTPPRASHAPTAGALASDTVTASNPAMTNPVVTNPAVTNPTAATTPLMTDPAAAAGMAAQYQDAGPSPHDTDALRAQINVRLPPSTLRLLPPPSCKRRDILKKCIR
jgi:predicted lipid-binding transport protein (Tim44 family)